MKSALSKDILRTIRKGRKRFLAIMIITILGVTMFSGLKASCVDLRVSADRFFDTQKLHDVEIVSTLGLTQDDVNALAALDSVESAQGIYSETVISHIGDRDFSLSAQTMPANGTDSLYILAGTMPQHTNECAVTQQFIDESGLSIGDTVTIQENLDPGDEDTDPEQPSFSTTEFKISAIVIDPTDVNNPSGSTSFRISTIRDLTLYLLPQAVDSDLYTAVLVRLTGADALFCFGDQYQDLIAQFKALVEDEIKTQREQARYNQVVQDAYDELDEAETDVNEQLADALQQLQDGELELNDQLKEALWELYTAEQELDQGWKEYNNGVAQLEAQESDARSQIAQMRDTLASLQSQNDALNASAASDQQTAQSLLGDAWPQDEWDAAVSAAQNGLDPVIADIMSQMDEDTLSSISDSLSEEEIQALIDKAKTMVDNMSEEDWVTLAQNFSEAAGAMEQLSLAVNSAAAQKEAQLLAEIAELETADPQPEDVDEQIAQKQSEIQQLQQVSASLPVTAAQTAASASVGSALGEAQAELDTQEALMEEQLAEAHKKLNAAKRKLEDGEAQLNAGWYEYLQGKEEGEQKLADGYAEYEDGAAEAEQKLADAREQIKELDMATWYLQDRTSLDGYKNIGSDADSIEAIGNVFPIVFFIVAILISLTTVTRMVEEDRGLIGTYKALGFTNREIRRKYLWYSAAASTAGSLIGTVFAFIAIPEFIFWIFSVMYLLPSYTCTFVASCGFSGPVFFIGGITLATGLACLAELQQTPATLMRPKAPRSGSRVFLEYIRPLWSRLSFLNKVTARNLFRYKKRLFMTIAGIAGCMALLLFGLAIKDSVADLFPRQYEQTTTYDLMAVVQPADNETLLKYMDNSCIDGLVNTEISSVTLKKGDNSLTVQIMIFPDGESMNGYISLRDMNGQTLSTKTGDVYVTCNAGMMLDFSGGDRITVRLADLQQNELPVTALVQNYMGNYIYMTADTFEQYFDSYEPNAVLAHFSDTCTDTTAFKTELAAKDGILSCVETQEMEDQFSGAFLLINMVVYIVIFMSAALAFVVLFTLSTTNISERERELATIKVLGFYDAEVHLYVDKETMILTCIGILCGIPVGYAFAQTLTEILTMPSLYLAVSLHPVSYLISAGLSLIFAVLVNLITDRSLDRINPVEALKSVE